MRFLTAAVSALALAASAAAQPAAPTKADSTWWHHVERLASDDFAGRLTGTDGFTKSAAYVAAAFKAAGMNPAGENGSYYQRVDFETQVIDPAASRVALTGPAGRAPLALGDDVVLGQGSTAQPARVSAPLVFIGYGIHLPESGHDDFAGVDLKGKVAVIIRGGPASLSGPLKAYAAAEELPKALQSAGAIGLIRLSTAKSLSVPWIRIKEASTQSGMYLADPKARSYDRPMFQLAVNPVSADKLFAASGARWADLAALVDAGKPLPKLDLKYGITATVAATRGKIASMNVVAELPGRDPKLAAEAVVLSAHLDHLGTAKPDGRGGDGVFRGAMDNASGVASLLEVAKSFAENPAKPRRSVVFVAVTGEEKGLLGSRHFADNPTVHAGKLVANINMDMFLPLVPLKSMIFYGGDESTLGAEARRVAGAMGVTVLPDPEPDQFIFIRSDQYNFVRRGVPAIMPTVAAAPGSPEAAVYKRWFAERYHAQADDLTQPVDLAAADGFNKFLVTLIRTTADAPARPSWNSDSFFKRFAN